MISAVGPFTELVHKLSVGDQLWIRGPYGNGFSPPAAGQSIALVGGGYGVAPLLWLAQSMQEHARAIHTIVGARTGIDLLYSTYFEALQDDELGTTNHLYICTEDGSRATQGRVTLPLEHLCAEGAIDLIYACGPGGMLNAIRDLAQRHALPTQLSHEAYMRCAVGICGACEHEGMVLCLDGPVVRSVEEGRGRGEGGNKEY